MARIKTLPLELVADAALARDLDESLNTLSQHQTRIMQQYGEGLPYERERIVHEARFYMAQSTEARLEAGKCLVILKENEPHGIFTAIVENELGLASQVARRMMQASVKFLSDGAQPKRSSLRVLGKTKLYELMVLDGDEHYWQVEEVEKDAYGFAASAPVIGERFRAQAATPAQTAKAELERRITGTDSATDAADARRANTLPFGGWLNPYKSIDDAELPSYLPRRGQPSPVRAPQVEPRPLSHVEAVRLLRERFLVHQQSWTSAHYRQLADRYPDGVPIEALETLAGELPPPSARIVSGR
ncbi:hypothetical protein [Lonsdalea populi]|uniref:hypothetical protein n=1 Tax=Lonsdalea populi TaxID=1172565 RepID=UPI0021AC2159|nr:hypothetical protein [Lonsdalea populi]